MGHVIVIVAGFDIRNGYSFSGFHCGRGMASPTPNLWIGVWGRAETSVSTRTHRASTGGWIFELSSIGGTEENIEEEARGGC